MERGETYLRGEQGGGIGGREEGENGESGFSGMGGGVEGWGGDGSPEKGEEDDRKGGKSGGSWRGCAAGQEDDQWERWRGLQRGGPEAAAAA